MSKHKAAQEKAAQEKASATKKRKLPAASAKRQARIPGTVASLCVALAALAVALMLRYGSAHDIGVGAAEDEPVVTIAPSYRDSDEQGQLDVYNYSSFAPMWHLRSDATDYCWRTDDFHGVPFSVEMADEEELDMDALTTYLLHKEQEWMQLPIRDWKDKAGSAYNTTSARYDQYNVLAEADTVPVIGALQRFIRQSARRYLGCVASSEQYFDSTQIAGDYFSQILAAVPPQPLYIMCWVNVFRADRKHANALHWHLHNWPFQGYLSVTSEGSGTVFRSNVLPERRWRFDHKKGMLFILPGGTLHSSTPWTKPDEPRITVAFNLAPPANARPHEPGFFGRWVWVELFSAEELHEMRQRGERWAMITQRPPNRYTTCMVTGSC